MLYVESVRDALGLVAFAMASVYFSELISDKIKSKYHTDSDYSLLFFVAIWILFVITHYK